MYAYKIVTIILAVAGVAAMVIFFMLLLNMGFYLYS